MTINHTVTKVVKRLPVNRLPVKLPITGFDFKLPITDLPTFLFTSCYFRLQLRLHWTQTYRRRPSPSNSSVPLVHVNPAFDCRVCSSPLPSSGGRSRERWGRGRGANWTAGVNYKDWSSVCHQLLLHARRRSSLTHHASPPLPLNFHLTSSGPSAAACWLQLLTAAAAL